MEQLEVTATRTPELVVAVPADVTIITGSELRARGAYDLRTALSLVAGVDAPPGGDTGPASAVVSMWGLHEFDAFLLVVDGVPWGGAFNPAIPSLNLTDVERIEVLKGAAPVVYGATAFVGVIQVIHHAAGDPAKSTSIEVGDRGSMRGDLSIALPTIGGYRESLAANAGRQNFSDPRERITNGQLLYRGEAELGVGLFGLDLNASWERQAPPSPVVRQDDTLTSLTPLDGNFNPADARIREDRYQATIHYSRPIAGASWGSTLSFTRSNIGDVRGFLRPDLTDDGSQNADSQNQLRHLNDAYADTHLSGSVLPRLDVIGGADLLYGYGDQTSTNGAYYVPLNGRTLPPRTTDLHVDEINTITDRRLFWGQYVNLDWTPVSRLDVNGGVRVNETSERRQSAHIDGFDPTANASEASSRSTVRLAGAIGASYRVWSGDGGSATLFADYRNTFKPAAVDFGPDYTPDVLKPETARSVEGGLKGALANGRLDYDLSLFQMDFSNLVVATTDAQGDPALVNAGGERLKGFEARARYLASHDLSLTLSFSYHDARFTQFVVDEDGSTIDVSGRRLTLSPQVLAAAGLVYNPKWGWNGSVTANYVGSRFLDEANSAPATSYATIDASLGYRWSRFGLAVHGYNLTDRRPPVSQSEFGSGSYYLLPARAWFFDLTVAF